MFVSKSIISFINLSVLNGECNFIHHYHAKYHKFFIKISLIRILCSPFFIPNQIQVFWFVHQKSWKPVILVYNVSCDPFKRREEWYCSPPKGTNDGLRLSRSHHWFPSSWIFDSFFTKSEKSSNHFFKNLRILNKYQRFS
jgi:hypothetical protein